MGSHYIDYACMGRPSPVTLEAVSNAINTLNHWDQPGTERTIELFEIVEKARQKVAQFISVDPKYITLVNNTTHGLGTLASLIPIESHENILVPDLEFISTPLVWRERQKQVGFEIRLVTTRNGKVTLDDVNKVIDKNTKVIMLSSVQEVSGYRADTKSLMDLATSHGAYLIADGIQEAGVLNLNLTDTPVHAYCSGGHKWLGNPFGLGFMYISPELMDQLSPSYVGYLSLQEPESGWDHYLKSRERSAFDEFDIRQEARMFESGGTPNWLGAVGLYHAISAITEHDIRQVERKVRFLLDYLRQSLVELGVEEYILGDERDEFQSGILTFGLPGGIVHESRLLDQLIKENVFVSHRSIAGIGGIRVSPYYTNTIEDIQRLIDVTKQCIVNLK